ncbi:MAG: MSMEG_6728 family protein [Actinobacteria bacterium]|nr:MSMEG_6728 family protein [Actinomycetota bacterium]
MQTFLPYADFQACATVLDDRRLGKQRVEALQIMRAVVVPGYGWRHHPAARMWSDHLEALACYGLTVCQVWLDRQFADSCAAKIEEEFRQAASRADVRSQEALAAHDLLPPWLGDDAFHRSHQSALVRKDPQRYRTHFPDVPDDLPYVWPGSATHLQPGRRR